MPPEKQTRAKTAYHVLKLTAPAITRDTPTASSPEQWSVVALNIEAANADAAVKQHVEKNADPGMYVAVPARSWQPTTVKIETQTVVKVG